MSSAATGGGGAATGGAAASTASSFVFENPGVYDLFEEADISVPVIYLPVGAKVFRADRTGKVKLSKEVPAFFGNRETIAPYAKRRNGEVNLPESKTHRAFLVKKSPRLFHMNLNSLFSLDAMIYELLQKEKDKRKKEFLAYSLYLLREYLDKEDLVVYPSKLLETPKKGEHIKYLNREIANIICKFGYDGWIVKPYDPEKRQGLEQPITRVKDGAPVKVIVPYPPEIMLCKWNEFIEELPSLEGGSRKRARKTRRRKQ